MYFFRFAIILSLFSNEVFSNNIFFPPESFKKYDSRISLNGDWQNSWHLDRLSQKSIPMNDVFEFENKTINADNIDFYVVDVGAYDNNTSVNKITLVKNFCNDNCLYSPSGHGTHISGIIAGKYGMWKYANIISVKVIDCDMSGSYDSFYKGINWIIDRHKSINKDKLIKKSIINISLQFGFDQIINNLLEQALSYKGLFVIVGAGNTNNDACNYTPSSCINCITVSSTDWYDKFCGTNCYKNPFANYGPCVDFLSPGYEIFGTDILSNDRVTGTGSSDSSAIISALSAYYINTYNIETQDILKSYLLKNSIDIDMSCSPFNNITTNKFPLFPINDNPIPSYSSTMTITETITNTLTTTITSLSTITNTLTTTITSLSTITTTKPVSNNIITKIINSVSNCAETIIKKYL